MADQNNAPERIWVRVTDKTVMYAKPSDADEFDVEYIRADRAAPEGQVRAQPALGYDTDCPECSGTGQRDSGGTHPWGEPAMMMCDCDAPTPAAPTDNTALVEEQRMKEHYRNCWKAQLERANGLEAALASREAPPASDSGEKPLCPVCYNRTDAELRTIGGFYSMESNCPECSPRAKERAKQDADREALVRLLQIITRNGSLDDGRTLHEVIADALLARGLRPPACQQEAMPVGCGQPCGYDCNGACFDPPAAQEPVTEALSDLLQAVCGETGFAASVRQESGKAYPWPALDLAEAKALRALKGES